MSDIQVGSIVKRAETFCSTINPILKGREHIAEDYFMPCVGIVTKIQEDMNVPEIWVTVEWIEFKVPEINARSDPYELYENRAYHKKILLSRVRLFQPYYESLLKRKKKKELYNKEED